MELAISLKSIPGLDPGVDEWIVVEITDVAKGFFYSLDVKHAKVLVLGECL